MVTYDLSKYRSVAPNAAIELLREYGWTELSKKDGIVSIWSTSKQGPCHKILLPLNPDLPDYPNKMIHALKIFGAVESRQESDLLEKLIDNSVFARERNRELLDLRLLPDLGFTSSFEFPAKTLGFILTSLQNLIDSIGQVEEGLYSVAGPISKAITEKTRLSVTGTAPGSFIVKLAGTTQPEQMNLMDQLEGSLQQKTLESFLTLIRISHEGERNDLRELLMRFKKRTTVTYKKFLGHLSSAGSGLDVRFGSVNPNIGGEACLNSIEILGLIDFLNDVESQVPEIISVDGTLKLFGERNNIFDFRIERLSDGEIFYGKISPSVLDKDVELTHNKDYRAFIEETELINTVTNESQKNWLLLDIDYLENALKSTTEREE